MARSFNGTSDHILAGAAPVSTTPCTISAWFKPTSFADYEIIAFVIENSVANEGYLIALNITSGLFYAQKNHSGSGSQSLSAAAASLNAWNHGAGVFLSGSTLNYLNGVGASVSDATTPSGMNGMLIGAADASGFGHFFPGLIADVAVWNVQLSQGEISALAAGARPNTVRPSALVAWWPLDGLQSPEPDLSGNANNGTLTGTARAAGPPVNLFTPRWPQRASLKGLIPAMAAGKIIRNETVARRSILKPSWWANEEAAAMTDKS